MYFDTSLRSDFYSVFANGIWFLMSCTQKLFITRITYMWSERGGGRLLAHNSTEDTRVMSMWKEKARVGPEFQHRFLFFHHPLYSLLILLSIKEMENPIKKNDPNGIKGSDFKQVKIASEGGWIGFLIDWGLIYFCYAKRFN